MINPSMFKEMKITIDLPPEAQACLFDFIINEKLKNDCINKATKMTLAMDDFNPERAIMCEVLSMAHFGLGCMNSLLATGLFPDFRGLNFPDHNISMPEE